MNAEMVLDEANRANLRLVRFLYCDNGGIVRGKATHVAGLARHMAEGIGQTLAMQAFAGVDALAAVEGMGPVGEFRLVPDPATFVVLPYAPHTGMMLCDMLRQDDRQPWEACPRTFLKRMIARAGEQGVVVRAAVEHEFYLVRETADGGYESYDRSLCYSSIGFDATAEILDDVIATLERMGVQVEQFMPELGPGRGSRSFPSRTRRRCARRIT
jgi:glutamine synthetase